MTPASVDVLTKTQETGGFDGTTRAGPATVVNHLGRARLL